MHNILIELFANNLHLFLAGLRTTLLILSVSMVISVPGGLLFGLLRCSDSWILRYSGRVFLEFYRVLPMPFLLLAGFS